MKALIIDDEYSIREGLSTRHLFVGALGVGFVVALLESLCTGQVYLPTLVLVVRSPDMRGRALAFLLLYNLMFILPLAVVMAIAYFGARSENLRTYFRRHVGAVKLAMAILFAALGTLVLATL